MGLSKLRGLWPVLLCALLIFGLVAGAAHAEVLEAYYVTLKAVPATPAHLAAQTGASATTWDTVIAPLPTLGNPKVTVYGSLSVASATCVITCGGYVRNADNTYTFMGTLGSATLTAAGSGVVDGARYPALAMPTFDTQAVPYYEIRIAAPSSGNVTVRPWCYGAKSQ